MMILNWRIYNKNAYEILKPYFYNKVMGLAPYSRTGGALQGFRYNIRPMDFHQIYILLVLGCMYVVSCGAMFVNQRANYSNSTALVGYLMASGYLAITMPGIVFTAHFQFKQKQFFRCLEAIDQLDEDFTKYNIRKTEYKYVSMMYLGISWAYMVAWMVTITTYFTVLHRDFWTELPVILSFPCSFAANCTGAIYFLFFVHVGARKCQRAHEILKRAKTTPEDAVEIIYDASRFHSVLNRMVADMNEIFGIPVVVNIGCSYLVITLCVMILHGYLPGGRIRELLFFTGFNLLMLSAMMVSGVHFQHQLKKTGLVLCEMDAATFRDYDVAEKKVGLLLQLLHEDVRFMAAGLFEINLELPFKYVNSVTAMVLFVQNLKFWKKDKIAEE